MRMPCARYTQRRNRKRAAPWRALLRGDAGSQWIPWSSLALLWWEAQNIWSIHPRRTLFRVHSALPVLGLDSCVDA